MIIDSLKYKDNMSQNQNDMKRSSLRQLNLIELKDLKNYQKRSSVNWIGNEQPKQIDNIENTNSDNHKSFTDHRRKSIKDEYTKSKEISL